MKIGEAFEKRDWGGAKPTWRRVPSAMRSYPRQTHGPSIFAVRICTRKRAKQIATGALK